MVFPLKLNSRESLSCRKPSQGVRQPEAQLTAITGGRMATITVMYYDIYSKPADGMIRSRRPATYEAITEQVKGIPIPETKLQVDDAWLDQDGFLKHGYL